jgi:hypothetical protein
MSISERFDSLDWQTNLIISALLEDRKFAEKQLSKDSCDQTASLVHLISRLQDNNTAEHRKTRQMIAGLGTSQQDGSLSITPHVEILGVPQEEESHLRKMIGNKILQSLRFASMTDRFEEVAEPYHKTCEWVFDDSEDALRPWTNFAEWLRNGESLYWLKGKAGSGKSTLMKYICDADATQKLLQEWRPGTPLSVASHFFWINGDREQRSQQGLLKTLLFEILNQQADLIPIVLPSTWARTYSGELGDKAGIFEEQWTLRRLTEGLQRLVHQQFIPLRLCFFIDGLDEFNGNHEEIVELFKELAAVSPNVKFCISSRPWVVFEEGFKGFPCLRLQDLSQKDINHYVNRSLATSSVFRGLVEGDPRSARAFSGEIVEKAAGVFVWVILVVRSLLSGIRNRTLLKTSNVVYGAYHRSWSLFINAWWT